MQNAPGYASRMFRALAEANVNIQMINTSEIRMSAVVAAEHGADAYSALLKTFELNHT